MTEVTVWATAFPMLANPGTEAVNWLFGLYNSYEVEVYMAAKKIYIEEVLYVCINGGLDGEEWVGCGDMHGDYSLQGVVHV